MGSSEYFLFHFIEYICPCIDFNSVRQSALQKSQKPILFLVQLMAVIACGCRDHQQWLTQNQITLSFKSGGFTPQADTSPRLLHEERLTVPQILWSCTKHVPKRNIWVILETPKHWEVFAVTRLYNFLSTTDWRLTFTVNTRPCKSLPVERKEEGAEAITEMKSKAWICRPSEQAGRRSPTAPR